MLSKQPIRVKLLVGFSLLLLVLGTLSSSGLYTMYAYRGLVKSLRSRVSELPVAAEFSRRVSDLRITLSELRGLRASTFDRTENAQVASRMRIRHQFSINMGEVRDKLADYRNQLEHQSQFDANMADNQEEWATVHKIELVLERVDRANRDEDWVLDTLDMNALDTELEHLQDLSEELPSHLHGKLQGFAFEVRGQYRTLIVGTWITTFLAALIIFALFVRVSWQWVLRPLRTLIHGSRIVASGQFGYRIHLDSQDEMAELAEALNDMTARFEAIRDDLDAQVRQRTKQVVRSEQLASVGFLAAGVAHEINNPLATIAMCAESLQGRLRERPAASDQEACREDDSSQVVEHYLQMIQDEAFRCKGITERLLDFSRMGPGLRENAELGELVRGVVEMVGHLGKYQGKRVEFTGDEPVIAPVNAQEIKQVVLNLLTNALDSTGEGGTVWIELRTRGPTAELSLRDNGCGMESYVLEHVFEPFFTRRRAGQGQGTGLGLSITYRIVTDHGGTIEAQSRGAGQGSTFCVRLPLNEIHEEIEHRYQAA